VPAAQQARQYTETKERWTTMIKLLTIEREYGCGGGDIRPQAVGAIGWTLWDQLLTSEVARRATVNSRRSNAAKNVSVRCIIGC
jgi:hypothetical protein